MAIVVPKDPTNTGAKQAAKDESFAADQRRAASMRAALQGQVRAAEGALPTVQRATQAGLQAQRQRSAQGMASALGQAGGMATGGGQAAVMGQAAQRGAVQEQQLIAQGAMAENQARQQAATARSDAILAEQEMGTLSEQRQQKQAGYDAKISEITSDPLYSGAGAFEVADPIGASKAIRALAIGETDPEVVAYIMQRAADVEKQLKGSGVGGFFADLGRGLGL